MKFAMAHIQVAGYIKKLLEDFRYFSGLQVNESKSSILFSNVIVEVREDVSSILNFKEKHLLVKYLGLPLFSSRLKLSECLPLIEKIRKRSAGWKTALLSYAGRAELINSTLSSLNIFWAETFVLPKSCMDLIKKHIRSFFSGNFQDLRKFHTVS
ncbi:hypothetical protein AAC387_Pa01g2034 [Persea americana]